MGIIRLTLITAALLWMAMYYFGRDDGLPSDRIGRTPPPDLTRNTTPPPAAETPAAQAAQPDAATVPAVKPAAAAPTPATGATGTADKTATPLAQIAKPEPLEAITPTAPASPRAVEPEPAPPAETPAAAPEPLLYVSGQRVNMRSGPATSFGVVTSLGRGTAVTDLGMAENGWHEIRLGNGETGFMSGDFLSPDPQ